MDGLAVLDALFEKGEPEIEVIVVSAISRRGGDLTMRALEKGAFDFIAKPDGDNSVERARGVAAGTGSTRSRRWASHGSARNPARNSARDRIEGHAPKVNSAPPQETRLDG